MKLNEKIFFPKELTCPICDKSFTRYPLRKTQFSISRRDMDYRPTYLGTINPRFFMICVCPHCLYAAEDKFFCPKMTDDDVRRKQYFDSHKAQWETQSRVRAAGSGQQIWKDGAAEKLKALSPEELAILKRITPLLQKSAAVILSKGKPYNEQQKEMELEASIRAFELAAICYKARRANHRILGYTYLNGAWCSRDAQEITADEQKKRDFQDFETAYLREAVAFLTIANQATSIDDAFFPDGTKIPKENLPQSRIFEIMYILAGAHRLLGNNQESDHYLEQIIYGSSNAQGIILWFVNQAREMRQDAQKRGPSQPSTEDSENFPGDDGSEE